MERREETYLKKLDENLLREHNRKFDENYPCGYIDYCNYCDIYDAEYPCAKAKIRMESEA